MTFGNTSCLQSCGAHGKAWIPGDLVLPLHDKPLCTTNLQGDGRCISQPPASAGLNPPRAGHLGEGANGWAPPQPLSQAASADSLASFLTHTEP